MYSVQMWISADRIEKLLKLTCCLLKQTKNGRCLYIVSRVGNKINPICHLHILMRLGFRPNRHCLSR